VNSRRKGKSGELQAARALRELLGIAVTRAAQNSGKEQADLRGTPGIHWEVKWCAKIGACRFMDQARADCGEDVPVVLMRENGGQWMVMVPLDELDRLFQRLPPPRAV
jgi:hypothetical protein